MLLLIYQTILKVALKMKTFSFNAMMKFAQQEPWQHLFVCRQWWDSAGLHWFYRTVSGNIIRTASRLALLLILVPLVETELADNI